LPPYTCDLNAIEFACAKVKIYVRDTNTEGNMTLKRLRGLSEDAFKTVTKQDWIGYCSHVRKMELQYWDKDGIVSNVNAEIILLGDETDSSSSESDTSEDKSESDDGNDNDLA
jgi:hypothetical protein